MLFGAELAPVFGRGFDWKVLNAQALESPISVPNSDSQCTLAHLSLELTINDYDPYIEYKNIDHYAKRTSFNDLSDEGMKPKTYTVRLQSGRFPRPVMLDLYDKENFEGERGFRLRLVFDQTPYRPAKEWKGERLVLREMKRDPTIFVSRRIKEKSWDSCLVG